MNAMEALIILEIIEVLRNEGLATKDPAEKLYLSKKINDYKEILRLNNLTLMQVCLGEIKPCL